MSLTNPRKIPRQARSQALVAAILDAAARILVNEGRDAANTNAIAIRAGVSIGSLYQYFPNREAILLALARRHGGRIHAQVAHALDGSPPATLDEAVARLAAALFSAHRIEPALHRALDHDIHHHCHDDDVGTKTALRDCLLGLPLSVWPGVSRGDAGRVADVTSEIIHSLAHAALAAHDHALEAEANRAALAYLRAHERPAVERPALQSVG